MSSGAIEYMMAHPELVEKLPKEMLEQLLELVRLEKARLRSEGGALPESAVADLAAAVPTELIQSIVTDNRRGVSEPGWLPPPKHDPEKTKGSGWSNPVPLEGSVPGVKWADQMMDVQDALDRKEREKQFKG
jgi:hypothetical protein